MTHLIGIPLDDRLLGTTPTHATRRVVSGDLTFHPSSYQDRHGRLFFWEGGLYRGIHPESADFYQQVLDLPLIADLCHRQLLVPTGLANVTSEQWPLLLKHATVPFVTYPFEWCGAMLRDAGLLIIDIMRDLATEGLCLGNPSPWDVLFLGTRPMFVDFTSIRPIDADQLPRDYDKLRRRFVFPLHLMTGRRERVARWLLHDDVHGVSPGDFARMSPHAFLAMKTRQALDEIVAIPRRLHPARAPARPMRGTGSATWTPPAPRELGAHLDTLRRLRQELAATQMQPVSTIWSEYYQEHPDITFPALSPNPDWNAKHQNVYHILQRLNPATINSFGCNRGWYEQQAALLGARVVCSDVDVIAVSQLYRDAKERDLSLQPLVLDVLNPSPGLGLNNQRYAPASERLRCDLVMALALTHHLVFEHRLGFGQVVSSLSGFTNRWLLIEFVPRDDAHLSRWCSENPSWYTRTEFEAALRRHYRSIAVFASHPSPRVLYLCEK